MTLRRRLTILSVAYPFAPIGADAVGGAEQVLGAIDQAIVAAGHRSVVIACEGSTCEGALVPVPALPGCRTLERNGRPQPERSDGTGAGSERTDPNVWIDADQRRAVHRLLLAALERTARQTRADVVHMHGLDFHAYLPRGDVPVLVTLHLPLDLYPATALVPDRPRTWLHGVSRTQMRSAPPAMPRLPEVTNGVRLDELVPTAQKRRRYVVALGRICPEKGFDLALEAAQRAQVPLLLAGKTFPYEEHERYFRTQIAPRLRAGCRYIGAVGPARKRELLGRARCLLVTSRIAETSSLAALEALACGTPVVAHPVGALPEIIDHGRTGFLAEGVDALARAIRRAHEIDPAQCRRAAERRFSAATMTGRYLDAYERVLAVSRGDLRTWRG